MRLIDADAFIEYIKETSEKLEFDKFHVDSALTAKIILDGVIADLDGTSRDGFKNAPTIKPEQNKGHWLSQKEYCDRHRFIPSGVGYWWWCSKCGEGSLYRSDFCPNCGAVMRGE